MDKKYFSASTKTIEGNKLIGALASTNAVDRDGDVIVQEGIDIRNYMKNPVLLWSHDAFDLPIGKVTSIRKSGEGMEFDAEFAIKENPQAKQVRDLMKNGYLNSFSIGFIVKERDAERVTESELIEISVVNIPSNPEALHSREYKSFIKSMENQRGLDIKKKTIDEITKSVLDNVKKEIEGKKRIIKKIDKNKLIIKRLRKIFN